MFLSYFFHFFSLSPSSSSSYYFFSSYFCFRVTFFPPRSVLPFPLLPSFSPFHPFFIFSFLPAFFPSLLHSFFRLFVVSFLPTFLPSLLSSAPSHHCSFLPLLPPFLFSSASSFPPSLGVQYKNKDPRSKNYFQLPTLPSR